MIYAVGDSVEPIVFVEKEWRWEQTYLLNTFYRVFKNIIIHATVGRSILETKFPFYDRNRKNK